jgi:hypothetical protein
VLERVVAPSTEEVCMMVCIDPVEVAPSPTATLMELLGLDMICEALSSTTDEL